MFTEFERRIYRDDRIGRDKNLIITKKHLFYTIIPVHPAIPVNKNYVVRRYYKENFGSEF